MTAYAIVMVIVFGARDTVMSRLLTYESLQECEKAMPHIAKQFPYQVSLFCTPIPMGKPVSNHE